MEAKQPIDIMTMIDSGKQQRQILMNKTCQYMKMVTKEGKDKKEIEATLKSLELPIDIHLAIFAHFSEICRHGKILTKTERMILS